MKRTSSVVLSLLALAALAGCSNPIGAILGQDVQEQDRIEREKARERQAWATWYRTDIQPRVTESDYPKDR